MASQGLARRPKAAYFSLNPARLANVWTKGRDERLDQLTELHREVVSNESLADDPDQFADIEVGFSTWGFPREAVIANLDRFPNLKAIFYAAGSVKGWAGPILEHGIRVMSAWRANAIPVAEFTFAQIILANKNYWHDMTHCRTPETRAQGLPRARGNFERTVSILGAGAIGRLVIERLKTLEGFTILVWDPFLSDAAAAEMGVEKVQTLDEAFRRADVVSNHIANKPETIGILKGEHFAQLQDHAVFINTGRHQQIEDAGFFAEIKRRPSLTALLDVSHPEPPPPDSPIYDVPNIWLTSHIAGSIGDEVVRMADYALEDFIRYRDGQPLQHEVTLAMLDTMA